MIWLMGDHSTGSGEQIKCVKTIGIVKVTLKASTPFVDITIQGCEKVSYGTILLPLSF